MIKENIKPQTLLSTLWIFILFNMLLRDLHEFPTEGYIEELMSMNLSDQAMLLYAFIVEIPILMVLLSRVLTDSANKWANIIAASVAMLGIASTLPAADLDDIFFAVINIVALLGVMRTAWNLSTQEQTLITLAQER
ncbi:MAG: hypothetical protein KTR30_37680 [Saprospiraceae bacterium]|nr:hypothetical protein [Saprospiraceae bacterium]